MRNFESFNMKKKYAYLKYRREKTEIAKLII